MMSESSPRFKRLLLIDDEPAIRRMMSLDLSADGYEVSTAADGAEGLDIFQREHPDLVITDLKMPGMDGLEVLKRIKDSSPQSEVIVITGHGDLELAVEALRLRASDFITKPINGEALEVALMRASERLALTRELQSYTRDLEEKVARATEKVLAAERLATVGRTVAGLVHSLKNMLSGLRGGLYIMEQHRENPNREQLDTGLDMLGRNIRRVKTLVDNLLMISKPREPELALVDGQAVLKEAVQCARQEAEGKGVELTVLDGGPVMLRLDRKMILDALANLISNAIDAAAESVQGRVEARLESADQMAEFYIQDNGPGLDEEAKERIFEAFYSSKGAMGTGLGLMAAQKTAQEHGGKVEHLEGGAPGALFRLSLPMTERG